MNLSVSSASPTTHHHECLFNLVIIRVNTMYEELAIHFFQIWLIFLVKKKIYLIPCTLTIPYHAKGRAVFMKGLSLSLSLSLSCRFTVVYSVILFGKFKRIFFKFAQNFITKPNNKYYKFVFVFFDFWWEDYGFLRNAWRQCSLMDIYMLLPSWRDVVYFTLHYLVVIA